MKVHCADRPVQQSCKESAKCHCQTAKSNLPLGKRQETLLSHNGHHNGYFPLPAYIRDSRKEEDFRKTLHTVNLQTSQTCFNVVYTQLIQKHSICKRFIQTLIVCIL